MLDKEGSLMKKSIRTTAMAVLILLQQGSMIAMALFDGDPATAPDWATAVPLATAAVGFLFARDQAAHDKGEE